MNKEIRSYEKLDKTIRLNNKVVVSDPCYTLDTWCQEVLFNVKPGEYVIEYYKAHNPFDGHAFCLTHIKHKLGIFPEKVYTKSLGIDAGMVGVFPFEEFRNDSIVPDNHEYKLKVPDFNNPGEKWYSAIIPDWDVCPYRIMSNCFVSESGYGDGCAELRVSTNSKGEVYRIAVVF